MAPDEARVLAVRAARRIGVREDPLRVEERDSRTLVVFPRHVAWVAHDDVGQKMLAVERQLLGPLSSRVPVPLPVCLLDEGPVSLRTRLGGRPGLEHHRRVRAEPALVRSWADELSALAVAMHTAFSVDEQAALVANGLPDMPALALGDVISAAKDLPWRRLALDLVEAHRDQPLAPSDRTFLHGDLGSHNLLVDEPGRVVGLLDLEKACVGDRHHELRWLPSYDPNFLARFLESYRDGTGALVDERRVWRLHALVALEQYGLGRTLAETRAWALQALEAAR